jgi:hypothetical protein
MVISDRLTATRTFISDGLLVEGFAVEDVTVGWAVVIDRETFYHLEDKTVLLSCTTLNTDSIARTKYSHNYIINPRYLSVGKGMSSVVFYFL